MGIETEYGISALAPGLARPGRRRERRAHRGRPAPDAAVQPRGQGVRALDRRSARRLGLRDRDAAPRHPRLRDLPRGRPPGPADRHRPRHGQRHPDQRRPALRRPRAPGVLQPRGHLRAGRGPLRQGRRRRDGHRRAAGHPVARPVGPAVQEQHRRQGRLLRHPRELPAAAQHAVRPDRHPVHRVPGLPPGDHRRRPGRHRPGEPAAGLPDQPAGGLLRGRGRAWRPP